MALIEFGGGIKRMSGSIAGNIFDRGTDYNAVRGKTKPVDKNTANQQRIRSTFAYLSTRWAQTLSDVQRTAWGVYGSTVTIKNRLLEDIHVSGFHHYLRSNIIRLQSGLAPVDNGPVVMSIPASDPAFAIEVDEFSQEIYVTFNDALDWANENDGHMFVYQGRPMTHQTTFFRGTWRSCGDIEGSAAAAPAIPATQQNVFVATENQNQFAYARIGRADGRLSEQMFSDSFRSESHANRYDYFVVRSNRKHSDRLCAV